MLDEITAVTEGEKLLRSFIYHMDGQIANATRANGRRESDLWDGAVRRPAAVAGTLREPVPQSPGGLMIHRNGTEYTNEPAVTGGNPVLAGGKVLFNDLLANTLGEKDENAYRPVAMTAFGESDNADAFFTGKPLIGDLGYAFLFRNYRAEQGKWQTADPLGYPDGWNNLAYVNNKSNISIDPKGLAVLSGTSYSFSSTPLSMPRNSQPSYVGSATPTTSDQTLWAWANTNANLLGYEFQYADNARHYLDATGTDLRYSTSFTEDFFTTSNYTTFEQGMADYISKQTFENTINFSTSGSWNQAIATSSDPGINHWLANQGFRYAFRGRAENLSNGAIEVSYSIYIHDFYQFNNTGLTAGIGLTDEDWRRLAEVGLALPYNIYGQTGYKKFVIE